MAASFLSLVVPAAWLPWLGVVPILLGVLALLKKDHHSRNNGDSALDGGFLPVTLVTIANGADNVALYVPLFAVTSMKTIAIYGVVFALMIALWCLGARWLVRHPAAGAPLRRWGPRLVPWVLIALGLWILGGG